MNIYKYLLTFSLLTLQTSLCFSKDLINIVVLPDPFKCHQLGFELAITKNSTLGIMGTNECESDRPTYGKSNDEVNNTFSRILVPWRYSLKGIFQDGYFIQTMVGVEHSEFRSNAGSSAEVSFTDIGLYSGYQWFWSNGFNVSGMVGIAILAKNRLDKHLDPNESSEIIDYLDKNTKTNVHPGIGVVLGWSF